MLSEQGRRNRLVRAVLATSLALCASPAAMVPLGVHAASLSVGDVLLGGVNGRIYHYDEHGALIGVLDTQTENAGNAPSEEAGMCFDPALDLYSTNLDASSMTEFDSQGNILRNPWAANFDVFPQSCVRDSTGNTYVGSTGPGDLRKFSAAGALLATYEPITQGGGVDGLDIASDGCTLYYTSDATNILRFNACTNTQLSDFADGVGTTCTKLRIRQDGSVLVSCAATGAGGGVYRLNSGGTVVQYYSATSINQASTAALDLDPDGTAFWVTDNLAGAVAKVDIDTGRVLLQMQTGIAIDSLAVVPGTRQADPPVAAAMPAPQQELVVCGNAPVSGLLAPDSTPCGRMLLGATPLTGAALLGQPASASGLASVTSTAGGVTVAGRGALPNTSLQIQYMPNLSPPCGATFWSTSTPPPAGAAILGAVTADGNGNYATAGALALPSPAPVGWVQVCALEPPLPGTSTPAAQLVVNVLVVSGTGPGTCLQSSTGHNGFTTAAGQGVWWNGDPGAVGSTGGVYAKISTYNPATAPLVGDVTASTMIDTPSPVGAVQSAQTGWTKGDLHFPPGTPPQTFAEYVDSTAGVDEFFSGVSGALVPAGTSQQAGALGDAVTGDSEYYATTFDPTTQLTNSLGLTAPGEFNFYVDDTLVASIPGTFTPRDTRVGTSVHAGADQVPGGVNDHEHFSDVYAYEPAGRPPSGSPNQRWQSFDAQSVTRVVTPLVSSYAQTSSGNPAAGATVDTWDSTCSM